MPATRTRLQVRISGVVQGVGFRPFVHRLAGELGLAGHVGNDAAGVFVEVAGPTAAVDAFLVRVRQDAPVLARVHDVEVTPMPPSLDDDGSFRIVASPVGGPIATLVPADIAICDDCRSELFDPSDRRYRHAFTTCTNCGPRFTIVRSLPYDRPATTMAGFVMCDACRSEYHDPTDRRFHAQPIACPDCGPTLRYEPVAGAAGLHATVRRGRDDPEGAGPVTGTEPALAAAQRCLAEGGTIAVKGVGGFHLACDATAPSAVGLLRRRKQRPDKPFAVMVADVEAARTIAVCSERELAALTSPQRPVVLVRRRTGADVPRPSDALAVADEVAPGNPWLGVMLPSSPLHELLLAPQPDGTRIVPRVLVMTSGNVSGEPICFDDGDAHDRLQPLVDGFLLHDRPIHVPCDDGVVREIDGEVVPLRRSRGDAPLPLRLPGHAPALLAVGAELKNTVGVASGQQAWLSQHIGDLGALETLEAFERTTEQLTAFFQVEPEHVAVDPHPSYATHAWARRHHRERLQPVQHHHAHAAALLAEHGLAPDEVALIVAFDGTGYGTDHTMWGGEVLLASQAAAARTAHLAAVPLPGGDSAVTNPARMALAHLWAAGIVWDEGLPCVAALTSSERDLLRRQLERDVACVPTSSAGRLFDAVSALLGVRQRITYEGQAAIELEWLADAWSQGGNADEHAPCYRFVLRAPHAAGGGATGPATTAADPAGGRLGPLVLDPGPVLRAVVADVLAGVDRSAIAAGFHLAVAAVITAVADQVAADGGTRTVGLTGGVFQNAWLTTRTRTRLEQRGHSVLTHRLVPANDGGLAYGQLAVVAARLPDGGVAVDGRPAPD
ncbi:MAG: carbamoyltransferase HypF [Nitriliruptoraceae bacterium]